MEARISLSAMANVIPNEQQCIDALLRLTLKPQDAEAVVPLLSSFTLTQRGAFADLADSNHVIFRAFEAVRKLPAAENNAPLQSWVADLLAAERARISNALACLELVCEVLEEEQCPAVVMKTLDHWPDLGNDLDLVSTGATEKVVAIMTGRLKAHIEPRSWGDRLANKWNFALPGLREAIEAHIGRLGQTGEHIALAQRFIERRTRINLDGHSFFVPAPEERIFAATLQRMYRHFYFRVCDIVNAASLVESGTLDFAELERAARTAGIWPGVASFLKIVSDYMEQYRGSGLDLPAAVMSAAALGASAIYARGRFLRVPVMPYGARLYTRQLRETAFRGDVPATLRLSLLPPLASAAAVAFKFTGSDKGVW
jgi:hypothetical protein